MNSGKSSHSVLLFMMLLRQYVLASEPIYLAMEEKIMKTEATISVLDLNSCGAIQEQIIRRSDRYCVFPWMPTRMQYLLVKIKRL